VAYDAIIIGLWASGLIAKVVLAQAGKKLLVLEQATDQA
jgi:predicted flavoprotein YhiN